MTDRNLFILCIMSMTLKQLQKTGPATNLLRD